MTTLGIDPATKSGLAIVDGPRLLRSVTITCEPTNITRKEQVLRELYALHPWTAAVIEDQWIGKTETPEDEAKARDTLIIRDSAASWRCALRLVLGVDVNEMLQPQRWRSLVFAGKVPRGRKACKDAAIRKCAELGWGVVKVDEAEAALIAGAYAWLHSRKK
jgi:hypothetical protein